jgi:rhomboid protease GluP
MAIEIKLTKTFLSNKKFNYGVLFAFGIVAACLILSNFYWHHTFDLNLWLIAKPSTVFEQGQYWRLLTTIFVHADLEHLLSNSMMLFILTYFVTSFYGAIFGPLLSLVMGSVINYIVLKSYNADIGIVGISGVIYYLWGFWLTLYIFIDKRSSFIRRVINSTGLFLILLIPSKFNPNTSYLAHYLGFAIGVITALVYYPFKRKFFNSFLKYEYKFIPDFEEDDDEIDYRDDGEETPNLH